MRRASLLKPDTEPSQDLVAGLALSRWLTDDKDNAIETYRQLIVVGREAEKPNDWADPETIAQQKWPDAEALPTEDLRAATLEKFPDLAEK